ncbi:MAG: hypothetical protein IPM68_15365 [Flavobacteriales bacterium]|nr:hypothetical protein [Flavobacteriales bacterium]
METTTTTLNCFEQVGHWDLHEDDGRKTTTSTIVDGQGREADLSAAGEGRFALVRALVR